MTPFITFTLVVAISWLGCLLFCFYEFLSFRQWVATKKCDHCGESAMKHVPTVREFFVEFFIHPWRVYKAAVILFWNWL